MPLVSYRRQGNAPPPERELLTVDDDGEASGWRSIGRAIGWFGGPVPDLAALRAAVAAADRADLPSLPDLPPDASVETIEIGGRTAHVQARVTPDGPWSPAVEACRSLLDLLVASPVAAICAVVLTDGRVRLEHRGSGVLSIELASLRVSMTLWRDAREAARAGSADPGRGRVEAGPGWSLEIAPPAIDLVGGGSLVAQASFVADDDGLYIPVVVMGDVAV